MRRRRRTQKDIERLPGLPAEVPARLRRGRALRRRLRDREHALDHDRAANTGVCDAAHARGISSPGAVLGADGVARDRNARLGRRALPRAGAREGAFLALHHLRATLPNNGLPVRPRTIIVSLLVGILVTVLASLRPAFRATRVPPSRPCARVRRFPPARFARFRVVGAILTAALGFALVLIGLFVAHGTAGVLLSMLVGVVARVHRRLSLCRSSSSVRLRAFSAGRPRASEALPVGWPATTPSGIRSERRRPRRRS